MADEAELIGAIHQATQELEAARSVVRDLANDLAEVADVIEPVLTEQAQRIRQARMAVITECRETATALKEFRDVLTAPSMLQAVERSERLLAACKELEEFRMAGFLDAFLASFVGAARDQ